jgi:hypothetical protein
MVLLIFAIIGRLSYVARGKREMRHTAAGACCWLFVGAFLILYDEALLDTATVIPTCSYASSLPLWRDYVTTTGRPSLARLVWWHLAACTRLTR